MHEVVVLVPGFVLPAVKGRMRAAGTITLIAGSTNVIVDTGDPAQRDELLDGFWERGMSPLDIQYVVNTHGHLDHVGNNNLFPHATFILDSDVSRDGEYWIHDFAAGPLLIGKASGAQVAVQGTPGHTDHDLSVVVPTSDGVVAIVGDLFEYEDDSTDEAWRAWSRDPARQQASRAEIQHLADFIVPGHGPMFRNRR